MNSNCVGTLCCVRKLRSKRELRFVSILPNNFLMNDNLWSTFFFYIFCREGKATSTSSNSFPRLRATQLSSNRISLFGCHVSLKVDPFLSSSWSCLLSYEWESTSIGLVLGWLIRKIEKSNHFIDILNFHSIFVFLSWLFLGVASTCNINFHPFSPSRRSQT